jgi:membrane associated rhomboid family serine protease
VFGGLFGVMLAQGLGAGPAWLLFVLTGAVGNLVNAWWQPPSHLAIGASTGVFGLLGAQVACDQVRRGRMHLRAMRRWAPIILGVALLAWLGGSGDRATDRIDVAAHFFGFVAGLGLGAWLGWRTATAPISPRMQNLSAAVALGLVAISWVLAFR